MSAAWPPLGRRPASFVAALVTSTFAAVPAPARAEEASPVVVDREAAPTQRTVVQVLRVTGSDQLFARVVAELHAQGFEVASEVGTVTASDAPGVASEARSWLDASRATGAGAALALASTPLNVRIWVINAATGKQVFREAQREPNTELDNAIVALWAVELLRATGIASPEERPAPSPAVAPAAGRPIRAVVRATAPRTTATIWSLQLGPAIEASPGGASPALALSIGGRVQPLAHFGGEAGVFVPLTPAHVTNPRGEALLSIALAHAGAFVSIQPRSSRWRTDVGLGGALVMLDATGARSQDSYATASDRVFAGGPYGRVGVGVAVMGRLRLRSDALAGAVFPRPLVLFDEARAARWGQPWFALRLALEAAF